MDRRSSLMAGDDATHDSAKCTQEHARLVDMQKHVRCLICIN